MFRQRFFISSILFLVLAAGAMALFVQVALKTRSEFQAVRNSVIDLETRARRAGALQARWESVKGEGELINRAILDRKNLSSFFSSVEATATAAGVTESNTLLSEANGEMRFRLSASGPFPNLFVFITHLNVLPTLLFVEEVNVHAAGTGTRRVGTTIVEAQPTADVVVRVPLSGEAVVSKTTPAASSQTNGSGEE